MTRPLPVRPSLEQLRKQAKDLVKAHDAGDASCCALLRGLRRFAALTDAEILDQVLSLSQAQFALALDYGYSSWPALAAGVQRLSAEEPSPKRAEPAGPKRALIEQALAVHGVLDREYPDRHGIRTELFSELVCIRAAGVADVTYEDLVVLSGLGTSFSFHPAKFWFMYQPPDGGDVTARRIERGAGIKWEGTKIDDAEAAWVAVRGHLDQGKLVRAAWLDDFVIAGYREDEGRELYVIDKWGPPMWLAWSEWEEWVKQFGWMAWCAGRAETEPRGKLVTEVLERTLVWARGDGRKNVEWMADGVFGVAGMEAYEKAIRDAEAPVNALDPSWRACFAIHRQAFARQTTATWLERNVGTLRESVRPFVHEAATLYQDEYLAWQAFRDSFAAAEGESEDTWRSPAHRHSGADHIAAAIALEKRALSQIERALAEAR